MREWHLTSNDPLTLTLAADARLANADYVNDQIWELTMGKGSPPALAIQTTFGLRARMMRIFPRFHEKDDAVSDPNQFFRPPAIQICLPNYIQLTGSPFEGIEVTMEYWAPLSQAICGKVSIQNQSDRDRHVRLDWIGQLTPTEGQRLSPSEIQGVSVLSGQTADLNPLIFLTNGPKFGSGSYPCLSLSFDFSPGDEKNFHWAQAALQSKEASFAMARSLVTSRWEAEKARIEMQNASQIEIYTGDPDWDACLMLTQKVALGLFISANQNLPYSSIVHSRHSDQGFSMRGDGTDYNHLWSGQSILDVYCLSRMLSPVVPEMIQGLIKNFLDTQAEDGFIDLKPGLAGQRRKLLATPILSTMILQLDEILERPEFLEESYPKLLAFLDNWFSPINDRDRDGLPEWSNPAQYGYEDHITYSPWNNWSQGVNISTTESSVLCAFLYQECLSLITIAEKIGKGDRIIDLKELAVRLSAAVEAAWDENLQCYLDWDRDTHHSPSEELLAQTTGAGLILLQRSFTQPVRLLFHIHPGKSTRPNPTIYIHGISNSGRPRVEPILADKFRASPERISFTTESVYSSIEQIEIRDLNPEDQVSIFQVGLRHREQSLFTPLWAKIPDTARAAALIEQTLLDPELFWKPFSIPLCPNFPADPEARICRAGSLFWNEIIGTGLLAYGFRDKAVDLVKRQMQAAIQSLRADGCFRQYVDSITGIPWGEVNALNGLAPLGLFMETLGVRFYSHQRLMVSGFNPFPWPITVKYRGTEVLRQQDATIITFPSGQKMVIDDPAARMISLT
ncbi:MAG TPA: hypothetical protein VLM80_02850 [Anaerolineales bacterium]|nr:hypothetical protein [Anaerolineales bacterium]